MPQPVAVLLRQSLILKAAIADCLDDPKPKPVHHLRGSIRRLEAALELLTTSTDIANLRRRSKAFKEILRKISSAAGKVRDIDVHLEMLSTYKQDADAIKLKEALTSARENAARKLHKRLAKNHPKVGRSLEALEITLKSVVDLDLSGAKLAAVSKDWLATTIRNLDPRQDKQLHSLRKACKTARYIAEIGSDDAKSAATLAHRLINVQQTTGIWHDCLLLLDLANANLPKDSPLVTRIHTNSNRLRRKAESSANNLIAHHLVTKAA
jgi:CHAD domain-containing protein